MQVDKALNNKISMAAVVKREFQRTFGLDQVQYVPPFPCSFPYRILPVQPGLAPVRRASDLPLRVAIQSPCASHLCCYRTNRMYSLLC